MFRASGISAAVLVDGEDDGNAPWISDSFSRAREHTGAIFRAALITFCAFVAGMVGMLFVSLAADRIVGWRRLAPYNYAISVVEVVVVASVLSWLGASIPLILRKRERVWTALKESVKLSSGYEGALFLLVVESTLGGLVAWYLVVHSLRMLFPEPLRYAWWYGYFVNFVGVLASAAVDPPLFIGLSLLAEPERLRAPSSPDLA